MNKKLPDYFGKERLYNNHFEELNEKVILWESLPIQSKQRIIVRFLSVNSDNRQGIRIAIDAGKGSLTLNGASARQFFLWENECPKEFEIECESDEGYLSIYNIFERMDWAGVMRRCSQFSYSGMLLEQSGNIYRYSCNNATLDSKFDELVFEIELL